MAAQGFPWPPLVGRVLPNAHPDTFLGCLKVPAATVSVAVVEVIAATVAHLFTLGHLF